MYTLGGVFQGVRSGSSVLNNIYYTGYKSKGAVVNYGY